MEEYRLKSKLTEDTTEYLIQTVHDQVRAQLTSSVYVNGDLVEEVHFPHPEEYRPEQIREILEENHEKKKNEIAILLSAYRRIKKVADPDQMYHLATAFYYRGLYYEGRELLKGVLTLNPDHDQAWNFLGLTELALGNTSESIEAGQEAIARQPSYADYRCNLGNAFREEGQYAAAVEQLEKAVQLNMYYGDAYINLANTLISNALQKADTSLFANVVSRSEDCLRKARMTTPEYDTEEFSAAVKALESADLKLTLAQLTLITRNTRDKRYRKQVRLNMQFLMHGDLVAPGALDERIEALEGNLKLRPNYADLRVELSRSYLEKGRAVWGMALEEYRRALEINPSLDRVRSDLESAQKAYDSICNAIELISAKG